MATVETIIKATSEIFGVPVNAGRKPEQLKAKYAANILLRHNTDLTMTGIANIIGLKSRGAASNNIQRAYKMVHSDENFKATVESIEKKILKIESINLAATT